MAVPATCPHQVWGWTSGGGRNCWFTAGGPVKPSAVVAATSAPARITTPAKIGLVFCMSTPISLLSGLRPSADEGRERLRALGFAVGRDVVPNRRAVGELLRA